MSPLYDYLCLDCKGRGRRTVYPDRAEPPEICEICDGVVFEKLPAAPAIRFAGAGWQTPSAKPDEKTK